MGDPSEWACERRGGGLPVAFLVGATGFGVGVGCGCGVGFGAPLNVAGVPVLGSAAAGIAQGASRFRGTLRGAEQRLLRLLPAGAAAGAGCGVGVGYGFGAGFFLKPSAATMLARRASAVRNALLARLPPQLATALSSPSSDVSPAGAQPTAPGVRAQTQAQAQMAIDDEALQAQAQAARRLEERVAQLSDSVGALRSEHGALRAALCAAPPPWAEAYCERTRAA